jgi:hypothetical protein
MARELRLMSITPNSFSSNAIRLLATEREILPRGGVFEAKVQPRARTAASSVSID